MNAWNDLFLTFNLLTFDQNIKCRGMKKMGSTMCLIKNIMPDLTKLILNLF